MNTLRGGAAANGQPVATQNDFQPFCDVPNGAVGGLRRGHDKVDPAPLGAGRTLWGASTPVAVEVALDKTLRRDIDEITQRLKALPSTRERSLAITKLQEATMWLGMDLKRIGEANPGLVRDPYPNGKTPENAVIDKTADGLKM